MARYVDSPDELAPMFTRGEDIITPVFWKFKREPERGEISVDGDRCALFRTRSLAIALHQQLASVLGPGADVAIYQTGKSMGTADAEYYLKKTLSTDCSIRLATGPVTFAFHGFAKVRVLKESHIVPDEDFILVYDHLNAFEADAVLSRGEKTQGPVDFFNAGYSAGWCSIACGLKLESKEISCRAAGDETCRFVMAPAKRIRERVARAREMYCCKGPVN